MKKNKIIIVGLSLIFMSNSALSIEYVDKHPVSELTGVAKEITNSSVLLDVGSDRRTWVCTGIAISRTKVLTAAHCLLESGEAINRITISDLGGHNWILPYDAYSLYIAPDFDINRSPHENLGKDLGVIDIEQSGYRFFSYTPVSQYLISKDTLSDINDNPYVSLIGIGYNKPDEKFYYGVTTNVDDHSNISYNEDTYSIKAKGIGIEDGDSGGPILIIKDSDEVYFSGVASAGTEISKTGDLTTLTDNPSWEALE